MSLNLHANRTLIRVTQWMILAMILIIPVQIIIFMVIPMPETAVDWMILLHEQPLEGILHLDVLYIINNTFLIFFYFVLYITLKKDDASWLNIALITGIVGAILYYVSNRSIELLYLSNRYHLTSDASQQLAYIAIAENHLDIWKGTAFNIYYVLSAISLLIFSVIMIKDTFYSKKTAIFGLISGILMIIPSSVGTLGMIFALLSLIPWIAFSYLVMMRLMKWTKDVSLNNIRHD